MFFFFLNTFSFPEGADKESFFAAFPKRPSREKKGKRGHRRFNGNVIIYRVLSEYKVYLLTLLAIKSLVRKDKYIRYTYV